MDKLKIEIQDENGNIYYPHSNSDVIFFEDGETFQQKLNSGKLTGPKGSTGATGPQGPQGIKGDTGAKGDRGLTGPQGEKGDTGAAGAAATIAVGTVTTGAEGSAAAVTNAGTSSAARFNFTIPRGATGAKGATGPQGIKGDTGATGPQGIQGIQGPKGDTGATGATGPKGATGAAGADGATWLLGTTAPTTQGKTDDFYINTANYDIYSKATGNWTKTGNIRGAVGAKGADGKTWYTGDDGLGPTQDVGNVGDFYLDTTTFQLCLKHSNGWGLLGTIKGPTGATGPKGDKGVFDTNLIVQNATTNDTNKVPSAAVAKDLQDQISEINTNISTTYNYDKMYNLWYSSGNVITDKVGKMIIVTIALQAKSPLPLNVWHKLIALPAGSRPAHTFYGNYDNGTYNTTIKVEANGDVLVLSGKAIAANEWLVGSVIIAC
nr:MAG TPA: collagen triple helix repeat protein [Caudoviricetes sp.]